MPDAYENAAKSKNAGCILMTVAIIALITLVLTIISFNFETVKLILNAKVDNASKYGEFQIFFWDRALLILPIIGIPLLVWILQANLTQVQDRYNRHVQIESAARKLGNAIEHQIAEHRKALDDMISRLQKARHQQEFRIELNTVKQELEQAVEKAVNEKIVAVMGYKAANLGGLDTVDFEVHGYNRETRQKDFLMIVHVFKDVAFWEFEKYDSVIGKDGTSSVLWNEIESSNGIKLLSKYDQVIGIGLESKTLNTGDYSEKRAYYLCSRLHIALLHVQRTQAFGLDIGQYGDDVEEETHDKQVHAMRPVVIVGVIAGQDVNTVTFIDQLLREVEIPGIDFGSFENLKEGRKPVWIKPPNCDASTSYIEGSQ